MDFQRFHLLKQALEIGMQGRQYVLGKLAQRIGEQAADRAGGLFEAVAALLGDKKPGNPVVVAVALFADELQLDQPCEEIAGGRLVYGHRPGELSQPDSRLFVDDCQRPE